MTERLYYTDSHLTDFVAEVIGVRPIGTRHGVVLDRTAFYPTSGGQPFDTGTLGSARVVEVVDQEDGSILHVVEGGPPHGRVEGRVDWNRRFEHMQQHTGQHVLSAAFDRIHGIRTVSFHLGAAASTIDLAREATAAEIARAEDAANDIVWRDLPVSVRFVDEADAVSLPLRKEPVRGGRLRIVEVDGVDISACGGTHVTRTGAIGMLVISSWERFRGGSRLEFRCGSRALRAYRVLRESAAAGTQLMSVSPEELPRGIERLQTENRDMKRRVKDLEGRVAAYEAETLAAKAETIGGIRAVVASVAGLDMNGLKGLAQSVAARADYAALLCSDSSPVSVVVARSSDVPVDAARVLKGLIERFGGKGGGRPELAQGGGLNATAEQILAAARSLLSAR